MSHQHHDQPHGDQQYQAGSLAHLIRSGLLEPETAVTVHAGRLLSPSNWRQPHVSAAQYEAEDAPSQFHSTQLPLRHAPMTGHRPSTPAVPSPLGQSLTQSRQAQSVHPIIAPHPRLLPQPMTYAMLPSNAMLSLPMRTLSPLPLPLPVLPPPQSWSTCETKPKPPFMEQAVRGIPPSLTEAVDHIPFHDPTVDGWKPSSQGVVLISNVSFRPSL